MKQLLTSLYTISLFFLLGCSCLQAQTGADTLVFKERYGLRLGIDLSKALRTFLEEDYRGMEIMADYRFNESYYLAAELGNEQLTFNADYLRVTSNGSYIKAGVDYNAYDNWAGMENMLYAGVRYGFASFSQTLEEYTIYKPSHYFPTNVVEGPFETTGLNASWLELIAGIKVEIFRNLYLGANLQLKHLVTEKTPPNFNNLTIPGFNRTYDFSRFGVGYGYSVSYLIPLYKKARD